MKSAHHMSLRDTANFLIAWWLTTGDWYIEHSVVNITSFVNSDPHTVDDRIEVHKEVEENQILGVAAIHILSACLLHQN